MCHSVLPHSLIMASCTVITTDLELNTKMEMYDTFTVSLVPKNSPVAQQTPGKHKISC